MMNAQQKRPTVVVGIDGSEHAVRAARWGAAEAKRRQVPLRLVTAFGLAPDHGAGHPGLGDRYRDVLSDRARDRLTQAAALVRRELPDIEVEEQFTEGHPVAVLVDEATGAEMLVLGNREASVIAEMLAGSVAVALAVHASCPVVVVRGPEQELPATESLPIVVGIDGSPTSEAAIAFAFEAAAVRHAPLIAVHTWWDAMGDQVLVPLLDWDAIQEQERELLAQRLAGWAEKYPDVAVERVVARDLPAHCLLEHATRSQLLVVGSRGRGRFTGLILGSVSHALLHRAACPVAVVHARPDTEGRI